MTATRIRRRNDRGTSHFDWLDSRHTFSFADYYDPDHIHFGALRVINEDRVKAGAGFGMHGHRDMEILTWVLEGALAHRDSLGNGAVIRPGELQRMTAGTGIRHSEFNASTTEPVHFLQIWIVPNRSGLNPGYEQKAFSVGGGHDGLRLIAAPDGRDGAVTLHQDALVWVGRPAEGETIAYPLTDNRRVWLQVARGRILLNGETTLLAGDGVAVETAGSLTATALEPSELLLFDLA